MNPVWLVQVAGYPLLIWLLWIWFGIPDRSVLHLSASVLLGLFIILWLGWLLASAFTHSLRIQGRLPRAALFSVVLLVLLIAVWWLKAYNPAVTDWIAVRVSNARGSAINPQSAAWVYPVFLWTMLLTIVALILPPLLLNCLRPLRSPVYWASFVLLAMAGYWIPWFIVTWIPTAESITVQTLSMVLRWGFAYLIALAALLAFAHVARSRADSHVS